ncbi:drug/metabolite transporter (DMT)-like permease [Rhodopseudomonas julia]|uniref:Drug/metabolite transporter (DMT)-like permease n=1 Tax=Rhodopseudomonas julia TaxID=200617 RepID=A0ABU0C7F5_9BRAD|nr:DMT family transporter [Rhodopseudomonas julia]MDQ0326123.1 drug/metabolite transporter (DMT)-like permease [Rhodopseudomonas julia]
MRVLFAPFRWLFDQPYLLLTLTSLFWAGNAVVARAVIDDFSPILLAQLRWGGAALLILPFAMKTLRADWPVIRRHLGVLTLMALCGITLFNTLLYWALEYTTALNVVLLQATTPLAIAFVVFMLFRERLTFGQLAGIVVSLIGVVVIVSRGQLQVLAHLRLNPGDVIMLIDVVIYATYSALLKRRPPLHWLSFLAITVGWGAIMLLPASALDLMRGGHVDINAASLAALFYVAVFPSVLAYICFNRGVDLIGPNRAGPFFHLVPLFGAILAVFALGESFTYAHAFGGVCILGGVFLASRRQRLKKRVEPERSLP